MVKQRIVNFNLFTIQYPLTAVTSLLHRISGVFVFLLIPFLLWMFDTATYTSSGFDFISAFLNHFIIKFILWLFLVALWYHLFAGVRHLLMDIGFGEDLLSARLSAKATIALTIVVSLVMGFWLW
jgi:succinate dehydrogenase / fumarate reductase cytochrome b subunit